MVPTQQITDSRPAPKLKNVEIRPSNAAAWRDGTTVACETLAAESSGHRKTAINRPHPADEMDCLPERDRFLLGS
jgi:hypothetical protein